jgi:hypothetical protein
VAVAGVVGASDRLVLSRLDGQAIAGDTGGQATSATRRLPNRVASLKGFASLAQEI